jgi:transcription elongation GreA/GreB family factor
VSVAFRRESDEEHKEPKFELPIPAGPNLVTQQGLALIAARIAVLETLIETSADAPAIEEARRGLRYWATRQTTAVLAPIPAGDEVAFGTRVTYRQAGTEKTVAIVGDDEADPGAGSISFSAPLARALMGAAVGEVVDFGGRPDALEVVAVAPIP